MAKPPSSPDPIAFVNLFDDIPLDLPEEHLDKVCELGGGQVRIERIVSHGHASPDEFWYDQDQDEWVLLLRGEARLRFAHREQAIVLRPGDSILLPAHCRHRVDWTTPDQETIWLAVFPASG
jgi:cupin 2 domain-containing protein